MLLSWEYKIGIYMRNKIPITMSMKSARFMFVIMWLKMKKSIESKKKVQKEEV